MLSDILIKARRDTSKLVQVQRVVTKNGKTFTQKFWVNPTQVKPTDTVIGNHHNLPPQPGSVPKPTAGVLSQAYVDSIISNRAEVIKYLKDCGVTWNENSNPGINWMRAMMAMKSALNGQSSVVVSASPATIPQGTQTTSVGLNSALNLLNAQARDEFDKCNNGREKVALLKKKLGQDGCIQFAKTMGVTWNEHTHSAINNMRMSMALQDALDAAAGTVSPKGKGGAPKGNDNAKKDNPNSVDNKLKVPSNATQRQKNIIQLINEVDSVVELETYATVGMLPEDDVAKSFIMDKLAPKYVMWKNAHASSTTTAKKGKIRSTHNNAWGFGAMMSSVLNVEGIDKGAVQSGFESWYGKFHMNQILDPRDSISAFPIARVGGGKQLSASIIDELYHAYSTYTTDDYEIDGSTWAGRKPRQYATNLGYMGWDETVYRDSYSRTKDGFVRYLEKIAQTNPEVASQVQSMISTYETMLDKVGYNPQLLQYVLKTTTGVDSDTGILAFEWGNRVPDSTSSASAKITLDNMEYQAKVIPQILRQLGYSDEIITSSLKYQSLGYFDGLTAFTLYDKDGNYILDSSKSNGSAWRNRTVVDLTTVINPDTGEPYFNTYERRNLQFGDHTSATNSTMMEYTYYKLTGELTEPDDTSVTERWNHIKAIANLTREDFAEVQKLSMQLFGLEVVRTDYTGNEQAVRQVDYDTIKEILSPVSDYKVVKAATSPRELDTVIANLNFAFLDVTSKKIVAEHARDSVSSPLNDYGDDFSGNYKFYYPTNSMKNNTHFRIQQHGNAIRNGGYTLQELNDQIDSQLQAAPVLSSGYLDQLTSFYQAKSNNDPDEFSRIISSEGFNSVGDRTIDIDSYINHPIKDVLYTASLGLCSFVPKMVSNVKNLDQAVSRRLNYVPYDFTATTQPTLLKPKNTTTTGPGSELQKARQTALKSVNCTLSTEDSDTSLQMRKDMLKNFDYDGVTHKKIYDGGNAGGDRRVLFNSRFFKINNSNMEENFNQYQTQIGQTPDATTYYHGTSYGSAAGIIGASGGWKFNTNARSGRMLGSGAYFGNKVGKIMPYASEVAYSYTDRNADRDANGVIILANLLQGDVGERTTLDPDVPNSRSYVLGYETAVRNNNCIFPHHMVDVSCRSMNRSVTRDANGNYVNMSGVVTHDKYGQALDMK